MKTVFIAAFHFVFIAAAAFGGQGLLYRQPAEDSPSGWERQSLPVGCGHFGANVFGLVGDERVQVTHNADLTLALEREMCTGGGGFMLIVACDSAAKRKIRRILETGSPIKGGRFYDLSLSL